MSESKKNDHDFYFGISGRIKVSKIILGKLKTTHVGPQSILSWCCAASSFRNDFFPLTLSALLFLCSSFT